MHYAVFLIYFDLSYGNLGDFENENLSFLIVAKYEFSKLCRTVGGSVQVSTVYLHLKWYYFALSLLMFLAALGLPWSLFWHIDCVGFKAFQPSIPNRNLGWKKMGMEDGNERR